nr:RNA polymerase alpha subunit [Pelargonium cotyledonis]YP_009171324.1 RNA polymerase alpha subunit [Pelargonium cotyledonis]AJA38487.1 RNA polymerase alpha subunit [Pelargonium cotyledonis]AJA38531.1 RNA polymerase alpha subunit [Pelargonium cotyledonis]
MENNYNENRDNRLPQWQFLEYREIEKDFVYGKFSIAPLKKGEAQFFFSTLRKSLYNAIECASFTHAKFIDSTHELRNIVGVQESISEILFHFNQIKLKSNLDGLQGPLYAIIDLQGPRNVTALDIQLPPGISILDTSQKIATVTEPVRFVVELMIETNSSDSLQTRREMEFPPEDGYAIDAVFTPIRNVSSSIHLYDFENENGTDQREMLVLEIFTDGRVGPYEALVKASKKVLSLFLCFLSVEQDYETNQKINKINPVIFSSDIPLDSSEGEDFSDIPLDSSEGEDFSDIPLDSSEGEDF